MTPRLKKFFGPAVFILIAGVGLGVFWFIFFGGGYHAELWLSRFDQTVWRENKTDERNSPRRPMVKSLMRHLEPGMSRQQVETLLGPADYETQGWQSYHVGYPRWEVFALDHDVFEVRYEKDRLIELRLRNT